jgi:uncharacterized protein YecE (DUF72 family)
MRRKGKIHIGTSGWHYKHWIGTFYPEGTHEADQLDYYLRFFQTVEINNSFYKLPSIPKFAAWKKAVPANFIFVVKASRFITHMKKLNLDKDGIRKFFTHTSKLRPKLGAILFQLPPQWKINIGRLYEFLKILPKEYRYCFEFRHPSWYHDAVYELLGKFNCAFCIYELAGHKSPMEVPADFVYVRLHGPGANKYQGSYSKTILRGWAKRCLKWKDEGKDVFVYFDNDQAGYAAFNAITLSEFVNIRKPASKQVMTKHYKTQVK